MAINNCNKLGRDELRKSFFLIMLVVFLSNSLTVFYFKEYIADDILWYTNVVLDIFKPANRNFLHWYFEWPMWNLMVYSPKLTHLLYILIYMTPVSYLYYYIYRKYLGVNTIVSFTAAVLPHVSANLSLFPAYTNGSYLTYQLLIGSIAVVSGLWSIEKSNIYYFFVSTLLFALLSLLTEFAVFLYVPYVFIFIFCFGFLKRVLLLTGAYTIIVLYKLYSVITLGSKATGINIDNFDTITYRFQKIFLGLFPVPEKMLGVDFGWLFVSFVLLVVVSSLINIFQKNEDLGFDTENFARKISGRHYILFLYIYCVVWLVAVSFFILVSSWFTSRYFYLATFPFSLLLSLALYPVVGSIVRYNKFIMVVFFLLIIASSGYYRSKNYFSSQSYNMKWGKLYFVGLTNMDFPQDAQIYIVDKKRHHNGMWYYSRGYIQFHAGRSDLSGHIGDYNFNYTNPFLGKRDFTKGSLLKGLRLKPPLFMYRIDRDNSTFIPYNFFLKWDNDSKDSTWILYDLDPKDGTFTAAQKGKGWERYVEVMPRLGLADMSLYMVALGGCPSDDAVKRLGLTGEDLSRLKGCDGTLTK